MVTNYVETLAAARGKLVEDRRVLSSHLVKDYQRGKTEEWRKSFIEVQAVIEAIDRAIGDEQYMLKKEKIPFGEPAGE